MIHTYTNKILYETYSVFLKVRRIRGTEAPSTRQAQAQARIVPSSYVPIPLHPFSPRGPSDPHSSCRFSGAAEICPLQTSRPCRSGLRHQALQKPKSPECVSKRFVSGH